MTKPRWATFAVWIGAVLIGIATVFHPPLTNPWNVGYAMHEVAHDPYWRLDHSVLMVGLTFWLLGLAYLADITGDERALTNNAGRLFISSLAVWYIIIAAELAVLPQMLHHMSFDGQTSYQPVWNVVFTWGLFAGYLAMVFVYLGIFLLSFALRGVIRRAGLFVAWIAIIGVVLSLCFPKQALIVQLVTAPLPYMWTFWYAWLKSSIGK
jgi:hypothetical protein